MTLEDLKAVIAEIVSEHLQSTQQMPLDKRSVDEVLAAMDQVRWTPPAGSPSTTELLREDRDR